MRHLSSDLTRNRSAQDHESSSGRVRYRHPTLPPIFYAVLNRSWRVVIRRARTHASEVVTVEDVSGNSPLHFACRLDPPRDVIYALQRAIWDRNKEGATALHIAASHRCSAEVIQALLDIGGAGQDLDANSAPITVPKFSFSFHSYWSSKKQIQTAENHHHHHHHQPVMDAQSNMTLALTKMGRSPLHYACLSFRGLGVEAFLILLEATIQACKQVNEHESLTIKSEEQELDTIVSKNTSDIHSRRVSAFTMLDNTRQTPLALLFQRYKERVRLVVKRVDSLLTQNHLHPPAQTTAAIQADLGELWEKAKLIVGKMVQEQQEIMGQSYSTLSKTLTNEIDLENNTVPLSFIDSTDYDSSYSHVNRCDSEEDMKESTSQTKQFRILHASVSLVGYGCPSEMIGLALSVHPHEISEMDEDGNLPLHIAMIAPNGLGHDSVESSTQMNFNQVDHHPFDTVIRLLLRYYPMAAKTPNGLSGHLPLRLAFDAKQRTWDDGLLALIEAFPPALEASNLDLKFYPFVFSLLSQRRKKQLDRSPTETSASNRCLRSKEAHSVSDDMSLISVLFEVVRSKPTLFGR